MSEIKRRILEKLPEEHRGPVSDYVDQQNEKGKKYGQTLEECPADRYDWKDMIIEELIDGLQYAHKRAIIAEERLKEVLSIIDR